MTLTLIGSAAEVDLSPLYEMVTVLPLALFGRAKTALPFLSSFSVQVFLPSLAVTLPAGVTSSNGRSTVTVTLPAFDVALSDEPPLDRTISPSEPAVSVAQANPVGLGLAALAGGFLIGMLLPTTTIENEKLGPVSDDLKDKAKDTASEAVDHGKQVAQEVASNVTETAKETVQESGQQHAEELKSSL